MSIAIPVILVTIVGLIASIILTFAAKKFEVKENPLFYTLRAELPGANCGGCGFAGCDDYAHALVDVPGTPCTKCAVGGPDCAAKLASLMGQDAGAMEKKVSFVMCNGTGENAKKLYEYEGIDSCKAAKSLYGGPKVCSYGCIGLGDCVKVCEFDALHVIDGVAVVDRDKCTSCGACVSACPQTLIKIVPEKAKVQVRCFNKDKGADAKKACATACIGCHMCEKACKFDAIHVDGFLSSIDSEKCKNCGACVQKCPTGAILNMRVVKKKKPAPKPAAPKPQEPAAEVNA